MPRSEVEDLICNVYELDNSSTSLHISHLSRTVGGNWPILDYNQWVEKPIHIGGPPNSKLKNCTLQPLDSVKGHNVESLRIPLNQNYTQSERSGSLTIKNPLNTKETLVGRQNQPGIYGGNTIFDQQILSSRSLSIFKSQPENECADSPTLTANSERSEITEASSDCNIHRGQQQFVRGKEVSAPKPQTMQQPGYNDMQVMQQHIVFKQLQEFHRQQQLGDLRQQNPLNQFSVSPGQAAGTQFLPLINRMPAHDATQMLRNCMQRSAAPVVPGASDKLIFPQEQCLALCSLGLTPQQIDVSLYGTPVSNARGQGSQYPQFQEMVHDSVNLLAKAGCEAPKSVMQSVESGNSLTGDQNAVAELQMKSDFGLLPVQSLNSGKFLGDLLEGNAAQVNASTKDFNPRQEQAVWPGIQQTKQFSSSQGLVPLDPMEAKILYNMDENIWDAFGSRPDTGTAGFGNTLEYPDSNSFSSIQCGTWSALMQSAVAEASSSDAGLQEELSSLTFQNMEKSTDNHMSNFADSERQQASCVDKNLSASPFSSKPFPLVMDSRKNSTFPGFHQPGIQLLGKQREVFAKDSSHGSTVNYSQKPEIQDGEKGQQFIHLDFTCTGQMVHSQHQMSNGPHVAVNSYEGVHESQEKQQNHQQMENSNDSLKGLDSHKKGHQEHLKFFGNFSSSTMNVDKGSKSNFEGSPRALVEVPSRGDNGSNASTSFHGWVVPEFSNISAQTSEHMLDLLHKVDQLKDDDAFKQFGSTDCSPLDAKHGADSHDTSLPQIYAQSSASQGFGLRLAPPSQMLAYTNSVLIPARSPQATNDLNSRQMNTEMEEKTEAWQTPSSNNTSPASHELAQRTNWDHKSGTSLSPYMNMQGNSAVSFSQNQPEARSQLQIHPSGLPVTSQSSQTSLAGSSRIFSPFNQGPSQDTSEQMHSSSVSQPFPNLDTVPMSPHSNLSNMSQQSENSSRPYNVWRNVPTQRQPFSKLSSSTDLANSNMSSTSWAPHVPVDQDSIEVGYKSSEVSTSCNIQGSDHGEELTGKEILQKHVSPTILDTSSGDASQGQQYISVVTTQNPGLLMSHAQQQDVDKQVQAMNNSGNASHIQHAAALGGQQFHNNILSSRNLLDGRINETSQPNSFPPRDAQVLGFSADAGAVPTVEAASQAALHFKSSQEIVGVGYNNSQTQSSGMNVSSNHTEHGHVNSPLTNTNSWFKQYGTLKNGQTLPMFDSGLAKAAASQFSLGKLSQNLHIQSPLERLDGIDTGQDGRIWPGVAATALVASQHVSSPYILSPEVTNQVDATRPKKRKIMAIELFPWHKEVKQETKRLKNLSVAEQNWAQATNRLSDKVADKIEMLEDLLSIHGSKRRLVLTTQLVQQLLHPAPASIFSVDAATTYGITSYFVSRLSLGDACSFSYCSVKDFHPHMSNSNINSENPNISGSCTQKILEVVNNFNGRTKVLQNEFERLETVSFANIRAELVDLERFTVINRFAKFHVRGQTDGTSSSSGMPKLNLQKHVLAIPMPLNLPEGVQCLSL